MSNIVIVGEITEVIRAQGNPTATGLSIDSSSDSPVVDGVYKRIPQIQVGIMPYSTFAENTSSYIMDTGIPSSGKHPWNSVGAVGLDAIFAPYTTQTESGRYGPWLPHFTAPSGSGNINSNTLNPFNIFNGLSGINPNGHSISNDPWMDSGHNISFALNYNPYDSGVDGHGGFVGNTGIYPNGSGSPVDINFEKDHFARHTVETQGIRGVGLRNPVVLSGPGYDINGVPVPSVSGRPHPDAAWNTSLWKSGPLDVRWDEKRGVWAAPSVPRIRFTILSTDFTIGLGALGCDHVIGLVNHVSCGGAGVSVGDEVSIYDPEYCYFNLPLSLLVGLNGTATLISSENYMAGMEDVVGCVDAVRNSGCIWMIDTLCCAEEETLYA
jgi:hypothetical protein